MFPLFHRTVLRHRGNTAPHTPVIRPAGLTCSVLRLRLAGTLPFALRFTPCWCLNRWFDRWLDRWLRGLWSIIGLFRIKFLVPFLQFPINFSTWCVPLFILHIPLGSKSSDFILFGKRAVNEYLCGRFWLICCCHLGSQETPPLFSSSHLLTTDHF